MQVGWQARVRAIPGWVLAAVAALGLAGMIAVFAAHGREWHWTGFDGNTSLWSWLQTFAQPFAFVYLTVRLISSAETWLHLMLFPVVVVLLPEWVRFHDWLNLMIAPFLLPLSCRVMYAYHTLRPGQALISSGAPFQPSDETRIRPRR